MPSLAAYEALVNDLLAATPAPDTGAEERLRTAERLQDAYERGASGAEERLRAALLRECEAVCTSGCHADDCEHHDHIPATRVRP